MYSVDVPYKNLFNKPRNGTVYLNLYEREVFKLLLELKTLFDWIAQREKADPNAEVDTLEVVEFYNNFEEVVLSAYGKPVNDGEGFDKSGRYDFENSALFNGLMIMCLKDPSQTGKLLAGIMPEGLEEIVKAVDDNTAAALKSADTPEEIKAQIEKLRAQLPATESSAGE